MGRCSTAVPARPSGPKGIIFLLYNDAPGLANENPFFSSAPKNTRDAFSPAGHTSPVPEKEGRIMKGVAFLCGIGLGMLAGTALEMMIYPEPRSMKSSVEQTMHKAGAAIDQAADHITSAMG